MEVPIQLNFGCIPPCCQRTCYSPVSMAFTTQSMYRVTWWGTSFSTARCGIRTNIQFGRLDIIDIAHNVNAGVSNRVPFRVTDNLPLLAIDEVQSRYYVHLWVADQPGVLAQIAQVFGDHGISIASCIQKETDAKAGTAELVIVTHGAREAGMRDALQQFETLSAVRELGSVLRIETP